MPESSQIGDLIEKFESHLYGGLIGVSYHDIKTGNSFNVNGDRPGWAASIIKVPVMIATYRLIDSGEWSETHIIPVQHKEYQFGEEDVLFKYPDEMELSIGELVGLMIKHSDNEATNMLADYMSLDYIDSVCESLGANKTTFAHLLGYIEPRKRSSWNPEGSNLTTPNDMVTLLSAIYNEQAARPESCKKMKHHLESCYFSSFSKSAGKRALGSKTGFISDEKTGLDSHEVGVVDGRYVLAVMCNKVGSEVAELNMLDLFELQLAMNSRIYQEILARRIIPW